MQNITIQKEFDAVQDKLEKIQFWNYCASIRMQGILPLLVSSTPKSLFCIHICQLGAYRMQNMTICKQFDAIQDALEYILYQNLQHQKSDGGNCN
jgi:hypothetical protein